MLKFKAYIEAARLKTLPLALSSPLLGSFFAFSSGSFRWSIFILATFTTLLLQILSNFANDYGDFKSGADSKDRIGPRRMVQSGVISPSEMKIAIIITVVLALFSGLTLIFLGINMADTQTILIFVGLGVGAIIAAITYTVGRNPYGYRGLGDISVFIFFGLVGVLGTYFMHAAYIQPWLALPAASVGLLSAGVLNLNNLRDYESDKKAHKRTMVVWLGISKARFYHLALIGGAIILTIIYVLFNFQSGYQFLFVFTIPLLLRNIMAVFQYKTPLELYPELKRLAISTFLFSVTLGLGHVL